MTEKRFFLDERVGCMAIIDRTLISPKDSNQYSPGLHPDSEGVIHYWMGTKASKSLEWEVSEEGKKQAQELLAQLNQEERTEQNFSE